jgi:hypothetical protein
LNIDLSVLDIAWNELLLFVLAWGITISVCSALLELVLLRMLLFIKVFFYL